jgi:hypothetical protein
MEKHDPYMVKKSIYGKPRVDFENRKLKREYCTFCTKLTLLYISEQDPQDCKISDLPTSNSNESGDLIENFLRLISYFWRQNTENLG